MKKLINLFSFLLLTTFSASAQDSVMTDNIITDQNTCDLIIELVNLNSDEGQLMVGLYNDQSTWLNTNYKGELTEIKDGKATVIFKNIPYGTYAASAVHDEDKNGKLKTGLFGIPTEPYASSRGAKGRFGPPKWTDAKFTISSPTTTETIKF